MITIRVKKMQSGDKKFTAHIPTVDGRRVRKVRFGQRGASDYTIHKDPLRMEQYVRRHGGRPTRLSQPRQVHKRMLTRAKSTKERWGLDGLYTAGFWSRWLLWSQPSLRGAARYMESKVLPTHYKVVIHR